MSFIKKLIGSFGLLCLFGCSNNNDEQERQDLLKWINHNLTQINQQIKADIEKEKQGFFVHEGKTGYQSKGSIEYVLKEKTGHRLEVSQHSLLTLNDIKNTEAYRQLETTASTLKVLLAIQEMNIDGDEVDSFEELDEYIDDVQRYFVITVSGW